MGFPKSKRGFTLIELLVVVAIVAILASMLLPALAHAKTRARSLKCKSALQDIGRSMHMYLIENDGQFPTAFPELTAWMTKLTKGRDYRLSTPSAPSWFGGEEYAYNAFGQSFLNSFTGLGAKGNLAQVQAAMAKNLPIQPVKEGDIVSPSGMAAIGDWVNYDTNARRYFGSLTLERPMPGGPAGNSFEDQLLRKLHAESSNLLFVDGHVQGFRFKNLYEKQSQDLDAMYNRDNKAHPEKVVR
ncbi:MAG TPA: type II secretion system protein [Methylomirabilota bacterium]|nr:type II secretion system protein [Methylomirabilota bacterium]